MKGTDHFGSVRPWWDIEADLKRNKICMYVYVCGVNSSYSEEGQVAGPCEHCNDHLVSIKGGKFLVHPRDN
jgi:hypothetical protein